MRRKRICAIFLSGCAYFYPAIAQDMSGNELLEKFRTRPVEAMIYVRSFVDTTRFYKTASEKMTPSQISMRPELIKIMFVCPPQASTIGQAADISMKYLMENPEIRNQPAASLVWVALSTAWPCTS